MLRLASQAQGYGNLTLTLAQQAEFLEEAPQSFSPIPGGWGKMRHTDIRLSAANDDEKFEDGTLILLKRIS